MPIVRLCFKGKVLQEYALSVGQKLTIGRKPDNDVVIDNLAVSGHHAEIESLSASFILTDKDSTNGTFVNEKIKTSHVLRNDDIITIGKHELLFDRSDLDKKGQREQIDLQDDKTRQLDTSEYQKLLKNNIASPPQETFTQQKPGFFARLMSLFR